MMAALWQMASTPLIFFGQGAIVVTGKDPVDFVQTEVDRDPNLGAGVNILYNRHAFIMHPRGRCLDQ